MNELTTCDVCGNDQASSELLAHRFMYGEDDKAVELIATIQVYFCLKCESSYTDSHAEERMEEAVCRHHNLLTPKSTHHR